MQASGRLSSRMGSLTFNPLGASQSLCNSGHFSSSLQYRHVTPNTFTGVSPSQMTMLSSFRSLQTRYTDSRHGLGRSNSAALATQICDSQCELSRHSSLRKCRRVFTRPLSKCLAGRDPASAEEETEAVGEIVREELDIDAKDGWQWTKTNQELLAYTLLLAAVPVVPILPRLQWSGALYFLFLALWSVYVGSHRSLGRKPPQKVSFKQGLAAPLFCSASLFGFYSLLRFFPNLDIRSFISAYLGVAGAVAVASNLAPPLRALLPNSDNLSWRIDFPKWLVEDEGNSVHLTLTPADIVATLVGVGAAIASKQSGAPFTLNNFIAVCIVTELLQLLSLGSFATAATMLCGLLLYDVFWVFGSSHVFGDNVMVTVATSSAFDGPMKLIFPQLNPNSANPYSILGLGDIAAPGLLIALMLRFDRSRSKGFTEENIDADETNQPGPDKTYFVTCIASYIFGLTVTVVANTVSGAAQPALLYLVPSLLFGVFIVAASRSEASLLLDYKEELTPVAVKSDDTLE